MRAQVVEGADEGGSAAKVKAQRSNNKDASAASKRDSPSFHQLPR
jgi:hypothetical protein